MKENKVFLFNTYYEKLVGLEMIPNEKKEKYPTVILVHGFGMTKSEYGMFDGLANTLAMFGFLVYRFDFSGCGESEGDYSETSLSKLKSDLSDILSFVKNQNIVDMEHVGIVAQSFGTPVTITLAPEVQGIILMGSMADPKSHFIQSFGSGYNPENISTKIKKTSGLVIHIQPSFWKDFDNYQLLESIQNIHCPLLFLHGEKDTTIPFSEMENLYQHAHLPKEKIIIEGADHSMHPQREKMYTIVVEWFKKYL